MIEMLAAWILYPLVLLALCGGLGLLVDVLTGRRLPGALVVPVGFAAAVVVGGFATLADATASLAAPLLALGALAGFALARAWRLWPLDPWPAGVAAAAFLAFGAPVIASGEPTFAGYMKLDESAGLLAVADRLMEHGRSLAGVEPSAYRAALEQGLAGGGAVGALVPFGAAAKLTPTELAWTLQPYLAFLGAMLALCVWQLAGGLVARPLPRALVAFVAAQPALLFGYALWGGVNEVAAAVLIALGVALAPRLIGGGVERRDVLADAAPLALAGGALAGVLSVAGLAWLLPPLAVTLWLAWRRLGRRGALVRAGALVAPLAIFAIPALAPGGLLSLSSAPLTDTAGEEALEGALSPLQALGVWPVGDLRFDPSATVPAAILIALALIALAAGLWVAWRHRREPAGLYASTLIAGAAIAIAASSLLADSPWVEARALAIASPAVLFVAIAGALALARLDRPTGGVLVAALCVGVAWSNALGYRDVHLAPHDRLAELEQIAADFAGEGPALATEHDPYAARYFLRELDADLASTPAAGEVALQGSGEPEGERSIDPDQIAPPSLFPYRTLILDRGPARSRPPSVYELAWEGEHYEVWQRPTTGGPPPVFHRLALGDERDRAAVPDCSQVAGLALLPMVQLQGSSLVEDVRVQGAPAGPPVLDARAGSVRVEQDGTYRAWLAGSATGKVELHVDGERVASARGELRPDGGFIDLGPLDLTAGEHEVEVRVGGAGLKPGSGAPRPTAGPLLLEPAGTDRDADPVTPTTDPRELCGQRWDWIEAVSGP